MAPRAELSSSRKFDALAPPRPSSNRTASGFSAQLTRWDASPDCPPQAENRWLGEARKPGVVSRSPRACSTFSSVP
eukprot:5590227-Pyramimonas_sp.AAC.1